MRLSRVSIQNYRSIKRLDLSFPHSGLLVLVGANNSGKSNVIRAIDNICGEQWFGKEKTQDHDFYLRDRSNTISIALTFDDGSAALWNSDEKWPLFKWPNGSKRYGQVKEAFPCVYLAADRTFDKHMAFYDSTLVGRIRRAFQQRARPVEEELKEKFEEVIGVFDRVPGFASFKQDFSELFAAMQADTGARLAIDFKPYTPSNYFKTMQVVAEDPDLGQKLDLDELGEGTRNMVLLALLRSYARNFRGVQDELGGLLALEEPEIYLHPQARRHLFGVLRDIASSGMQVIISTHSASFVDTEFFDSIGRVVKEDDDETAGRKCTAVHRVSRQGLVSLCKETGVPAGKVTDDNITEFYKTTSNPMLNEAFFARCVILVEGDTEELAFPVFLRSRGIDCDLLGISVISVRGKNQIPKYWRLFRAFTVPTIAVVDNDDRKDGAERSNRGLSLCFDTNLGSILQVDVAKAIRRAAEPTGTLVVLEQDYETALKRNAQGKIPGITDALETWDTEARRLIRPVGTQNKGQIARYVARKLVTQYPEFQPVFIDIIAHELESLGVVPGTGRDQVAKGTDPTDLDLIDDEDALPF